MEIREMGEFSRQCEENVQKPPNKSRNWSGVLEQKGTWLEKRMEN